MPHTYDWDILEPAELLAVAHPTRESNMVATSSILRHTSGVLTPGTVARRSCIMYNERAVAIVLAGVCEKRQIGISLKASSRIARKRCLACLCRS